MDFHGFPSNKNAFCAFFSFVKPPFLSLFRQCKMVFIGKNLDRAELNKRFDDCLVK